MVTNVSLGAHLLFYKVTKLDPLLPAWQQIVVVAPPSGLLARKRLEKSLG